jgi:predicted methyltransferase
MRRAILLLSALALSVPLAVSPGSPALAKDKITDEQAMAVVLADTRRDGDRVRDQYRHPAQTMAFCKVKPGMTVVDVMPGNGWYTRILAPYLGEKGHYIALNPDVRNADENLRKYMGNLGETFPAQAVASTGVPADRIAAYNSDGLPGSLNGKVQRVLIMRQVHNLWRFDMLRRELATVRALLDDGGKLCIEEHRARGNARADYTGGDKGYMRERDVIALIEANGFELDGKSDINQNKNDRADYPEGVWTLPPNLRGVTDEVQRARLLAIGESDRMTLVFKKRK